MKESVDTLITRGSERPEKNNREKDSHSTREMGDEKIGGER